MKKIKKGAIVVVIEGKAFGNKPSTITKVLAKPGRTDDETAKQANSFTFQTYSDLILCKRKRDNHNRNMLFCNNMPCYFEVIDDLRPATKSEKRLFTKNKGIPITIPEKHE